MLNYTSDLSRIFEHVTYGRGSVLLCWRSDTLCTSSFIDDVIFAHKPRLLDVAAQLKRSAHAALGLATVRSNASCRPTDARDYFSGAESKIGYKVATTGVESAVYDCLVSVWARTLLGWFSPKPHS